MEIVAGASHPRAKLQDVPERVSSSRFVGRRAELTRLEETWKSAVADERGAVVLIGGEAGVGKSRLVGELTSACRIPRSYSSASASTSPTARCRSVRSCRCCGCCTAPSTRPRSTRSIGPGREELAALLPELHAPVREGIVAGALFEQLLGVFERLAEHTPTLLVLEDLHWADRSTRELFAYLAGSLHGAPLLLVGTYRSDDLHRRHPLRALLAELDRSGAVERIDLDRFDRDEVRELIAAIVGGEPSPELVDRTFLRSDGNIFFAEELLAVDGAHGDAIPPTLREIVLARIDGLSEPAQQLLRCAAVIGRSADHRLLESTAGLAPFDLLAAAREAVAQHILLTDGDGLEYRFRHALVREAVVDDLLPGDRVALHTRVAETLANHPDWFDGGDAQLYAQLASHWDAARDAPRALEVRARRGARRRAHLRVRRCPRPRRARADVVVARRRRGGTHGDAPRRHAPVRGHAGRDVGQHRPRPRLHPRRSRRGRPRHRSRRRRAGARALGPLPLDAVAAVVGDHRALRRGRAPRSRRTERGARQGAGHARPAADARRSQRGGDLGLRAGDRDRTRSR